MRDLIRELEHIMPKNHFLGIFGSMSWGGGGVRTLEKFAETIKWELVAPPVEAKHAAQEKDTEHLVRIGKEMARRLREEKK
jgi:flavorubredoxin